MERAQQSLQLTQHGLARAVGASGRSGQRWVSGRSRPRKAQLVALARLLQPVDAELSALLAKQAGVSLPPTSVPANQDGRADAIVCAAAEAMDASPRVARRALAAALARARELGVNLSELEAALQ